MIGERVVGRIVAGAATLGMLVAGTAVTDPVEATTGGASAPALPP